MRSGWSGTLTNADVMSTKGLFTWREGTPANFLYVSLKNALKRLHVRVTCLPGAPCLLARGTRLGGIALYHVNDSCRAIPACRDEINREDMAARGKFFRSYHLPVLSAEQNYRQSEEMNVIDDRLRHRTGSCSCRKLK